MGLKRKNERERERERERESNRNVSRIRRFAIAMCAAALIVPMFAVPAQAASPRLSDRIANDSMENVSASVVDETTKVDAVVEPADAEQDVKDPTYGSSGNHGMDVFFRAKSVRDFSATISAEYGMYSTKLSASYENNTNHGETLFVWLSPSMGSTSPMLVRLPNAWTPAWGNSATVYSGDIQSIVTARTGSPYVKSASATLNKSTHRYDVNCSLGASSYKFGSWVTYSGGDTTTIGDKNPGSNTIYDPFVYVSAWVDENASNAYRSDKEGERTLYITGASWSNGSYGLATYDRYVHYQAKALSGRTVTKVIKLPAVNRFKIMYNANGSNVTNMPSSSSTMWSYQTATVSSQVPKRTGYTFDGWYTAASGGTRYTAGQKVTNRSSNLNLYAHWTPNTYKLTYVKNAPSGSPDGDSNVTLSKTSQTAKYDAKWGALATASKPGYTFDGWYTARSGGTNVTSNTVVKGDLTVYAHWTPRIYRLTYVKNAPSGSTGGDSDVTLSKSYQDALFSYPWGALATASKPGYTFKGWYTSPTGGTRITSDTIVNGNLTVYAHWAPVEYTIRFNGNGSKSGNTVTGSMASIKVKYDQMVNLPANKFKATVTVPAEDDGGETVVKSSVFKGWNQNPGSLKSSLADKASVMNLTSKGGAVVDLYAVWDNAPMFVVEQYPDRYFTLEEAHNGVITEEELLKTVIVKDRETNPLPHKTTEQVDAGDDVGVSIVGWDASEFTDMTDDGVVSIRYKVKDESGNEAYLNIEVYITGNGPLPRESYDFYRAISKEYEGTLPSDSRWLNDYVYQQLLEDAFSGESKTHSYSIDGSTLEEIRDYVDVHGMGNSGDADALNGLLGSFRD